MTPDTFTALHRAHATVDACLRAFPLADSPEGVTRTVDAYLAAQAALVELVRGDERRAL